MEIKPSYHQLYRPTHFPYHSSSFDKEANIFTPRKITGKNHFLSHQRIPMKVNPSSETHFNVNK